MEVDRIPETATIDKMERRKGEKRKKRETACDLYETVVGEIGIDRDTYLYRLPLLGNRQDNPRATGSATSYTISCSD